MGAPALGGCHHPPIAELDDNPMDPNGHPA